eukprot:COSAG02_NODE_183_length_30560_cov_8.912695_23_plen_52_part_00
MPLNSGLLLAKSFDVFKHADEYVKVNAFPLLSQLATRTRLSRGRLGLKGSY